MPIIDMVKLKSNSLNKQTELSEKMSIIIVTVTFKGEREREPPFFSESFYSTSSKC